MQKSELFEYYAEHHNYDMIMLSAHSLLLCGQATEDTKLKFSFFSGSMLLSFCSIESFVNSMAFLLHRDNKENFDFEAYDDTSRISDRLRMITETIGLSIDRSQGKFQKFERMKQWRNSLVHSKASSIGVLTLQSKDGRVEPPKTQSVIGEDPYENFVKLEEAKNFYETAYDIIEEIKSISEYDPRATCSYKKLGEDGVSAVEGIKDVIKKT